MSTKHEISYVKSVCARPAEASTKSVVGAVLLALIVCGVLVSLQPTPSAEDLPSDATTVRKAPTNSQGGQANNTMTSASLGYAAERQTDATKRAVKAIVDLSGKTKDLEGLGFASMGEARKLAGIGPPSVPEILERVRDKTVDEKARVLLMELATSIDGSQCGKTLLDILQDETEPSAVRAQAADRLHLAGDSTAPGVLLRLLRAEKDRNVWFSVVRGFTHIRAADSVPVLLDALGQGDYLDKICVCRALGNQRDERALPHLARVAKSPVSRQQPPTMDGVKEVAISMQAAIALGTIRSQKAVPDLVEILESHSHPNEVRCMAAQSLGALGGDAAYKALVDTLQNDKSETVVVFAVKALREIGRPEAAVFCRRAIARSEDDYVKRVLRETADALEGGVK